MTFEASLELYKDNLNMRYCNMGITFLELGLLSVNNWYIADSYVTIEDNQIKEYLWNLKLEE